MFSRNKKFVFWRADSGFFFFLTFWRQKLFVSFSREIELVIIFRFQAQF